VLLEALGREIDLPWLEISSPLVGDLISLGRRSHLPWLEISSPLVGDLISLGVPWVLGSMLVSGREARRRVRWVGDLVWTESGVTTAVW